MCNDPVVSLLATIASCSQLLSSVLQPLVAMLPSRCPYGLLATTLLLAYQGVLSWGGGEEYLIYGPHGDGSRPTLFSANREGILSSLGYLSLYLFSVEIGRWFFGQRCVFLPPCVCVCVPVYVKVYVQCVCMCDILYLQEHTQVPGNASDPAISCRCRAVDCNQSCTQPCASCVSEVCQWTLCFVDGEEVGRGRE